MLLDPETLDLADIAGSVLARAGATTLLKPELPACQVEIATTPAGSVADATTQLGRGRGLLAATAEGLARPAVAGVHPFAAAAGALTRGPRYDRMAAEYGELARRQRVSALQIHVAVGGADRTIAVHDRLRPRLPLLAALAANAAIYRGRDTGLASVRPAIARALPRQGVPPALGHFDGFVAQLEWGEASGRLRDPGAWWWELRPHPGFGTLELRVPDAQTTLADAGAVAAVAQCIVADATERHEAGERATACPDWRIAENSWAAARDGLDATFADASSGRRVHARECLGALLDGLAPTAEQLGCAAELDSARALVEANGAVRQRDRFATGGARELAAWLADSFTADAVAGVAAAGRG